MGFFRTLIVCPDFLEALYEMLIHDSNGFWDV